jgi:hypothetical protein
VRFRTKERPRGLLRPTHQKRLALLIGGFGLIMIFFTIVRRPTFWTGMFPDEQSKAAEVEKTPAAFQRNDIVSAKQGVHHDEFITSSSTSATDEAEGAVSVTANRPQLAETESDASFSPSGLRMVPAELLKTVQDDVIGVHSTESQAYYTSMKMASLMIEKNAAKAPKGAYALFMDSPESSRGMAWRIAGQLRRLSVVRGSANSAGATRLYDAWLTTNDSGDGLVHVVTMSTNAELTERLNRLVERSIDRNLSSTIERRIEGNTVEFPGADAPKVHFTGYFFKIEAYASKKESGVSRAPLFVAGVLHEIPLSLASSTRAEQMTPYMGWLALAISVAVLLMVWSFTMSDVAHSQTRAHQLTKLPAIASFEDVTAVSISESLSRLEDSGNSAG